jgi:hypothetical protein
MNITKDHLVPVPFHPVPVPVPTITKEETKNHPIANLRTLLDQLHQDIADQVETAADPKRTQT